MPRTLVLLRHSKSDWNEPVDDLDRPLNPRGRRQATEAGQWLAAQNLPIELAMVSPARRTRETWERASAEAGTEVPVRVEEAAYTFDGTELFALVRGLDPSLKTVVLVGHNPALEDLIDLLTGEQVEMKTSNIAVIQLKQWRKGGKLIAQGRPPPPL